MLFHPGVSHYYISYSKFSVSSNYKCFLQKPFETLLLLELSWWEQKFSNCPLVPKGKQDIELMDQHLSLSALYNRTICELLFKDSIKQITLV